MDSKSLLELKSSNLMKAMSREEPDFVPNMIGASCATVAWTGQKVTDVIFDPQAYAKAMTDVFADMWADGTIFMATLFTPKRTEAFDQVQNKFGPDGVTPEHIQNSPMLAEEYDQLIADPDKLVREVLLPRMQPRFYTDRAYAKAALKAYAEDAVYTMGQLAPLTSKMMREKYGIIDVVTFAARWENPMDTLFDYFRGFKGTLTDLRRYPDKVKAALEKIWEVRNVPALAKTRKESFPYACQMPHIPAYLNPKQFDELYWPYEKQLIEHAAANGSKSYVMLEGHWDRIWHHFLEVPKDSCILHVDDDDIFEAYKALGHHQIIMGGLKMSDVRSSSFSVVEDKIKRVIDTCAPGGAFLFASDKAWIAPGDVNQVLVDAFNFAHEYSKKR